MHQQDFPFGLVSLGPRHAFSVAGACQEDRAEYLVTFWRKAGEALVQVGNARLVGVTVGPWLDYPTEPLADCDIFLAQDALDEELAHHAGQVVWFESLEREAETGYPGGVTGMMAAALENGVLGTFRDAPVFLLPCPFGLRDETTAQSLEARYSQWLGARRLAGGLMVIGDWQRPTRHRATRITGRSPDAVSSRAA